MVPKLDLPLPEFLNWIDGELRLTGTRLGLYTVLTDYKEGDTAERIAWNYRTTELETVRKVLAFYQENKPAVDVFLAEYKAELDRQYAAGPFVDLEELRRRLAAKKQVPGANGVVPSVTPEPAAKGPAS